MNAKSIARNNATINTKEKMNLDLILLKKPTIFSPLKDKVSLHNITKKRFGGNNFAYFIQIPYYYDARKCGDTRCSHIKKVTSI